ncbi:MAG: hypothetical protein KGL11_02020 [Alphaproteobacteria bacterium]|nr:hypothetical protein [Alphaproteobacteria bacterium]
MSLLSAARGAAALLSLALVFFFAPTDRAAAGQCKDPWVTQAVQQVTGRSPNGSGDNGECNIYRYGGGHWSSYSDLVAKVRFAFGKGPAPGQAAATVAGQCKDPWVTQAVRQVTGRPPQGSGDNGECNKYRYGGGHWSNYNDLVAKVRFAFGQVPAPGQPAATVAGQCKDAWVTQAVRQVTGRSPRGSGDNGECNIYRYGGGHWTDYNDLVAKVRFAFGQTTAPAVAAPSLAPNINNYAVRPGIVGPNGGSLIGQDGAGVVSHDGGTLIGQDGAGVVGPGGASLVDPRGAGTVSQGGGNFIGHDAANGSQ